MYKSIKKNEKKEEKKAEIEIASHARKHENIAVSVSN